MGGYDQKIIHKLLEAIDNVMDDVTTQAMYEIVDDIYQYTKKKLPKKYRYRTMLEEVEGE